MLLTSPAGESTLGRDTLTDTMSSFRWRKGQDACGASIFLVTLIRRFSLKNGYFWRLQAFSNHRQACLADSVKEARG